MLVPMLDEAIELAAGAGAREVVLGMAHRGRLNVLAHTVGRPYETILAEFEGEQTLGVDTAAPEGGTGDVKYHYGASGTYRTQAGKGVTVTLSPNPSHLEYVNPVIEGRARADQTEPQGARADPRPARAVLPVLIHGDAAFPGQGVVAETLNLQALPGYSTGGTLHVIANNQLGFTTDPDESRSTRYASDLAKGFDVPIIHVNADDVEASIAAIRLALAFRESFGRDAVIDLIGYRRFGHNETDEPAYTQPLMYERIKNHPPVRKLYAERLAAEGAVSRRGRRGDRRGRLPGGGRRPRGAQALDRRAARDRRARARPDDEPRAAHHGPRGHAALAQRAAPARARRLRGPPQAPPFIERRRTSFEEGSGIDWAHAEALAFASLLALGVPVRLTGQDTERGTFSQRHRCCTTRRPASAGARSRSCATRWPRSSCTTARCRRWPASASSTATASRRPTRSCSGRPSSATS